MRSLMAVSLLATLIGYVASVRAEQVTIVCGLVPQSIDLCRVRQRGLGQGSWPGGARPGLPRFQHPGA